MATTPVSVRVLPTVTDSAGKEVGRVQCDWAEVDGSRKHKILTVNPGFRRDVATFMYERLNRRFERVGQMDVTDVDDMFRKAVSASLGGSTITA